MNPTTLENGLQIWMALVRSGLEVRRKNHLPGYDAELVAEITEALYPHAIRSLERELRASPPPAETFLEVFFGALKPFSQMLRDVLGMFEAAGARRSDENLRIAFDFDKASDALVLTLEEFREVEAFFRSVVRAVVERQWNSNTLFALSGDVEEVFEPLGVSSMRRSFGAPSRVRHPDVAGWIERNGRPAWLPFPGFPRSGDVDLDKAIGMAEGLIHDMLTEVSKLGVTYQEFTAGLNDLPWADSEEPDVGGLADNYAYDRPRRDFVIAAHDYWPNTFAENVCVAIEAVMDHRDNERKDAAAQLSSAIHEGFERPPRRERTRVSLERDFRDLINMPIWKRRHELYSVWVAARIADALGELSWEWYPEGDTLRFSFSGVELATLTTADGSTHTFWTEKRTVLEGGGLFGRKHIQPDYRVVTIPTHRKDATSLVVECKQYRKWSKKNFGAALEDYAKGCPGAPVVLVNYGPVDLSILEYVNASRRDRTFLVGNFRPDDEAALARFRDLLQDAFPIVSTPRIAGEIELELRWGPVFRDLDLHLFIRPTTDDRIQHIGLGSTRGNLTQPPWAEWPEDIMSSPPGIERITITNWIDGIYDVLVHDYSGTPHFPQGDVELRLMTDAALEDRVFIPREETGRWWHVCRIHGSSGRIEEINSVAAECPYHAT